METTGQSNEDSAGEPVEQRTLPTMELAEIAETTKHGIIDGDQFQVVFDSWQKVWSDSQSEYHTARFASLFRFPPEVMTYVESNKRKGHESIGGWRHGRVGMIGCDIDRDSLQTALDDAREVIGFLISKGVSPQSFIPFFSGSKGFSIHLFAEAFGPVIQQVQPFRHPAHEEAALLALKAVFNGTPFDASSRQTIRLFRLPNSLNAKSALYKVPLTAEEVLKMDIEAIKSLARQPRHDAPVVPAQAEDPALVSLLEPLVHQHNADAATLGPIIKTKDKKVRATVPAPHRQSQPSASASSSGSTGCPHPKEVLAPIQELLNPMVDLDSKTSPKRLIECWHGLGFLKGDTSRQDYHFVKALLRHGWSEEAVEKALWLRPGNKALSRSLRQGTESGQKYAVDTVANARRDLDKSQMLRPEGLVKVLEPKAAPNWLRYMPLWSNGKHGIGSSPQKVYMLHVDAAIIKEGFDPIEGSWSPTYFLAQSSLLSDEISVAKSTGTVARAQDLLKACGLLKLVEAGRRKTGNASVWKIYIPTKGEEESLRVMGTAAAQVLRDEGKKKRDLRRLRAAALRAKNALEVSGGSSDGSPDEGSGSEN